MSPNTRTKGFRDPMFKREELNFRDGREATGQSEDFGVLTKNDDSDLYRSLPVSH